MNQVEVDVLGLSRMWISKNIAEDFVENLESIACAGKLMGYDVDFNVKEKKHGCLLDISLYKGEDFYFGVSIKLEKHHQFKPQHFVVTFNESFIVQDKVMKACHDVDLSWDGFYGVFPKTEEDVHKVFGLMRKLF